MSSTWGSWEGKLQGEFGSLLGIDGTETSHERFVGRTIPIGRAAYMERQRVKWVQGGFLDCPVRRSVRKEWQMNGSESELRNVPFFSG